MSREGRRIVALSASFAADRSVNGENYGGVTGRFSTRDETTRGFMIAPDVQLQEADTSCTSFGHFFQRRR